MLPEISSSLIQMTHVKLGALRHSLHVDLGSFTLDVDQSLVRMRQIVSPSVFFFLICFNPF